MIYCGSCIKYYLYLPICILHNIVFLTLLSCSSDDSAKGECCPICLRMLNEEVIGTPESCDHHFCLECIEEWAKVMLHTSETMPVINVVHSECLCILCCIVWHFSNSITKI